MFSVRPSGALTFYPYNYIYFQGKKRLKFNKQALVSFSELISHPLRRWSYSEYKREGGEGGRGWVEAGGKGEGEDG